MKPIRPSPQSAEQIQALDKLYRHSKDGWLRQRAQIVLLAIEQAMVASQIASIIRLNEESVRRWLKRYEAEGIEGLKDDPRPGMALVVPPGIITALSLSSQGNSIILPAIDPRSLDCAIW